MTTHKLKCWPQYFDVIKRGEKTFEARKDDRGFQRGDRVVLMETYPNYPYNVKPAPIDSGRDALHELHFEIGWVLHGGQFGIQDGWCVFSLLPAPDPARFGQATEACLSNPYQAHLCIGFFAEAVADLHAKLADIDQSLAGLEAFDGNRATAIESLKARLEAQMECNLKLTRRIAGLVTELGEWLALADHQGLSTNSHKDRTRAALAAWKEATRG